MKSALRMSLKVCHVDPSHPDNQGIGAGFSFSFNPDPRVRTRSWSEEDVPTNWKPLLNDLVVSGRRYDNVACAEPRVVDMNDPRVRMVHEWGEVDEALTNYVALYQYAKKFKDLSQALRVSNKELPFEGSRGLNGTKDAIQTAQLASNPQLVEGYWYDHQAPNWWKQWVRSQTPIALARAKRKQEEAERDRRRRELLAANRAPKVNLLPLPERPAAAPRRHEKEWERFKERREKKELEEKEQRKQAALEARRLRKEEREQEQRQTDEKQRQPTASIPTNGPVDELWDAESEEESPIQKLRNFARDFRSRLS